MRSTMSGARTVTIGIRALRRACRRTSAEPERPLDSASSMYSLPSTSIISDLVKRAIDAMVNIDRETLGRMLEFSACAEL